MSTQLYFQCSKRLVDSQIAQSNLQLEEDAEMPLSAWHADEKIWRFIEMGCVWRIYCTQLAQPFTTYHTPGMTHGHCPDYGSGGNNLHDTWCVYNISSLEEEGLKE